MRLIDLFDRAVRQHAQRDCLVDGARRLTFRDVQAWTVTMAADLDRSGIPPGAKVAVLAPNCAEAVVAVLSVLRAGCVWLPANARATPEELSAFLALVGCDLVLVHQGLRDLGASAARAAGCRIQLLAAGPPDAAAEPAAGRDWAWDDLCSVFSTGGTTGAPKAAMWTHRTWATLVANFLAGVHHRGPPVHLVAAPFTHAAGVVAMPLLALGATTVLIPRAEPELVARAIAAHRVTTLFLPPTAIYNLLALPGLKDHDFGSLQNLIYAAAPMSAEKLKEAMAAFGPVLVQTYGQAEAPMVCAVFGAQDHAEALAHRPHRLLSCGRPGLLTDVAVLDEAGEVLPPGATGEISVRGDLVMAGYLHDPDATAAALSGPWRRTGDIGRMDEDGFVYITDRNRDMIITGGFNVFPSEIEQLLWSHPAVKDCAVVGRPDPKWGEAVVAVVELKAGARCAEDDLIALCKSQLGSVKAPKQVEIWPELPRSPVGKVLKRVIRERFWAGQDRQV